MPAGGQQLWQPAQQPGNRPAPPRDVTRQPRPPLLTGLVTLAEQPGVRLVQLGSGRESRAAAGVGPRRPP